MKKFLVLGLLAASCGSSHSDKQAALDEIDLLFASAPQLAERLIQAPPARPDRTDLFYCDSGLSGQGTRSTGYVEFLKDGSRLYHMELTIRGGITEKFTAVENAIAAAPFNPLPQGRGVAQSSNVLHGMLESTRRALGYTDQANFLINLRGSGLNGTSELAIRESGDATLFVETSLDLNDAPCISIQN